MASYYGWKLGPAANGTAGGTVKYFIASNLAGYAADIQRAFAMWSTVANIDFVRTSTAGSAQITLKFGALDGANGTVGLANTIKADRTGNDLVTKATITFDSAEGWLHGSWPVNYSLATVAAHEIGHVLGLNHSGVTLALMNALYHNTVPGPFPDDVAGARKLYGARGAGIDAVIYDGEGDGILYGSAKRDLIRGYGGNDTVEAGAGNDTIEGGAGNDHLRGYAGKDSIVGGDGADLLDGIDDPGMAVADRLVGGRGNDTYRLILGQDTFVDSAGIDTLQVQATLLSGGYRLPDGIENIEITGGPWVKGNGADNRIVAKGTYAYGLGGNDILIGGHGINDTLDGGSGNDQMSGGTGNDTYFLRDAGDYIDEDVYFADNTAGGVDTVIAFFSYALPNDTVAALRLENLTLAEGSAAVEGTGNDSDNVLTGNSAANVLRGGIGADTLYGGAGDDTLDGGIAPAEGRNVMSGGAGADIFQLGGRLEILDFEDGIDRVRLQGYGSTVQDGKLVDLGSGDTGFNNFGDSPIIIFRGVALAQLTDADFIFV